MGHAPGIHEAADLPMTEATARRSHTKRRRDTHLRTPTYAHPPTHTNTNTNTNDRSDGTLRMTEGTAHREQAAWGFYPIAAPQQVRLAKQPSTETTSNIRYSALTAHCVYAPMHI